MSFPAGRLFLAAAGALALACDGPPGPVGEAGIGGNQGGSGPAGTPFVASASVSSLSPGAVVQGRMVEVHVTGFATRWTQGGTPQVTLGAGVTVRNVRVASDTLIQIQAEATLDAEPGRRNAAVTANGETLLFYGGFTVRRSLEVKFAPTQLGRPSLSSVILVSHDRELPLPTTAAGYAFELPEGVSAGLAEAEGDRALLWIGAGIDAPNGAGEVVITLYPGQQRERVVTLSLVVEDQAVADLEVGENALYVPANGSVAGTFQVQGLVKVTLAATQVMGAPPELWVLGDSGSFDEVLAGPDDGSFTAVEGSTYHVIAWDRGGQDVSFTLQLDAEPTSR